LKAGSKTLTVKEAKDTAITFEGEEDSYKFGNNYYMIDNDVTMYSNFKNKFDASSLSAVEDIDATMAKGSVNIIGNDKDNVIYGGQGAATLSGGAGNDTLFAGLGASSLSGGAGNDSLIGGEGKDTFVYTGGNDTIEGYTEGIDKIDLGKASITDVKYNDTDVIFTIGSGGSITIKDAEGMNITTVVNNKKTVTNYTNPEKVTEDPQQLLDLIDDNNYMNEDSSISDITAVSDNNYSVGNIKNENNNELVTDVALTYGNDENK
jgi:hypothetical protein